MRRSRAALVVALAILLAILLAWWLFREEAPPAVEPPPVPEEPAAEFAPEEPAPPPAPAPAEIPMAAATIRVLDAMHGEPATESLLEAESVASAPGPALVVEDAGSGSWTVRGPRGSIVRYVASAAGAVPAEGWFTLGRREAIPVHLAPVAPCFLRVVNADDGKPVPGATLVVAGDPVLFRGVNAAKTWRGRTDSDGLASCPEGGPGRRLRVTVAAPGFAFSSMDIDAPPDEILVPLDPARELPLIVADEHGVPIHRARVLPAGFDGRPLLPADLAFETDKSGTARIPLPRRSPPRARTAVLVEAPERPARYALLPAEDGAPGTVVLPRPTPGGVTVVDGEGAPRVGVPVRLLPLSAAGIPIVDSGGDFEGDTDARGRVTLPAPMPEGRYVATVGGAGELFLVQGAFRAEELRAYPEVITLPSVDLDVRAAGLADVPLRSAEVLLLPPVSSGDPAGLPDRALELAPVARTGAGGGVVLRVPSVPSSVFVAAGPFSWGIVPWDGTAVEVRADLPAGPLLSVRVEDGSGRPAAGARVRVRPARTAILPPALRGRATQEAITGPRGTVTFEAPAGCFLEIRADGRGALDAAEVELPPLEPGGGVATLVVEPERTAWIAVEGGDKDRIRNACVEVSFEGLGARWLGRRSTGEQGVLAVPAPPPGSRGKEDRALFSRLGAEPGWGTLAVAGLVDGARVVLSPTNRDVFVLRVEESPLWPRGTPVRWRVVVVDDAKAVGPDGSARVGEECPILLGPDRRGALLLQLPDSIPFPLVDAKESDRLREEFYASIGTDRRPPKPRTKPRDAAMPSGSGDPAWSFPPLRPLDLFNQDHGWARARIVARRGSRWKAGEVLWTSAPFAPGRRSRVLVTVDEEWTVEWKPVLPSK